MNTKKDNVFNKMIEKMHEFKAKRAERRRINKLTTELIAVVKHPKDDAVEKINSLVKQGADVNTFDMDTERSLLHFSAEQNRLDVTEALSKNGCKKYINVNDIYGKDPAFYAIDNKNPQLLDFVLSNGVSVNRPADFNLMSSFRYAVHSGEVELAQIVHKHGADINDRVGESFTLYDQYQKTYPGPTPLKDLYLYNSKNTEMINFLKANGGRDDLSEIRSIESINSAAAKSVSHAANIKNENTY